VVIHSILRSLLAVSSGGPNESQERPGGQPNQDNRGNRAILENATATAVLIVAGVTIDAPEADLEKLSVDYRYRSRNGTAFAWHP
jgi:hypothetical protein